MKKATSTPGKPAASSDTSSVTMPSADHAFKHSPTKFLSPMTSHWDAKKNTLVFSREETPDELAFYDDCQLKADRIEECRVEVITDSIRTENYVISDFSASGLNPPDNNTPPTFQPTTEVPNPYDKNLPPSDEPTKTDIDVNSVVKSVWTIAERLFVHIPAVYISQHAFNQKSAKMAKSDMEFRLEASAKKTTTIILKEPPEGGKITGELIQKSILKKTAALKNDLSAENEEQKKQIKQLTSALKKSTERNGRDNVLLHNLQKEFNEFKALHSKQAGGPAEGALQTNQQASGNGKSSRQRKRKRKSNTATTPLKPPVQPAGDANPDGNGGKQKRSRNNNSSNEKRHKNKTWSRGNNQK